MPKAIVFPYGIILRDGGRLEIFPVVEIYFPLKGSEWFPLFLVIDSGATISVLPQSDAIAFGLEVKSGEAMTVVGIDDKPLVGWRHKIPARLGTERIQLPVVFLESDSTPRVLGRAGVFDRFILIFEEKQRRSGLIGEKTREAKSVQKILDCISNKQSR